LAKAEEKVGVDQKGETPEDEKGLDIGYGRYNGKPIIAVSMELQRRTDAIDEVPELGDEFLFIGRAHVDKHVFDPQSNGMHLVVKAASTEMFKVSEGEGRKLLNKKRDQQKQVEARIEDRRALAEEAEAGITRLPLGSSESGESESSESSENDDLPIGDPE